MTETGRQTEEPMYRLIPTNEPKPHADRIYLYGRGERKTTIEREEYLAGRM